VQMVRGRRHQKDQLVSVVVVFPILFAITGQSGLICRLIKPAKPHDRLDAEDIACQAFLLDTSNDKRVSRGWIRPFVRCGCLFRLFEAETLIELAFLIYQFFECEVVRGEMGIYDRGWNGRF
jgi:hypothetical protein